MDRHVRIKPKSLRRLNCSRIVSVSKRKSKNSIARITVTKLAKIFTLINHRRAKSQIVTNSLTAPILMKKAALILQEKAAINLIDRMPKLELGGF